MKKSTLAIAALITATIATSANARNDRVKFDIQPLLDSGKAKNALMDVPLYFGDNKPGGITKTYGEVSTNKKTNAFMKSDKEACEWAMLSALKALQERAVREGMNAVVNITSNYKNVPFKSKTQYECGAGNVWQALLLKVP